MQISSVAYFAYFFFLFFFEFVANVSGIYLVAFNVAHDCRRTVNRKQFGVKWNNRDILGIANNQKYIRGHFHHFIYLIILLLSPVIYRRKFQWPNNESEHFARHYTMCVCAFFLFKKGRISHNSLVDQFIIRKCISNVSKYVDVVSKAIRTVISHTQCMAAAPHSRRPKCVRILEIFHQISHALK